MDQGSEEKRTVSKRRQQRQCIVQCLYMWETQKEESIESLFDNYCEEEQTVIPESVLNAPFVITSLKGIVSHCDVIDAYIREEAQNWSFQRIAKIDLAILRLALYELLFCKTTPAAVVINEAIEISKTFSSEDSKRFINGILDKVAKNRG